MLVRIEPRVGVLGRLVAVVLAMLGAVKDLDAAAGTSGEVARL